MVPGKRFNEVMPTDFLRSEHFKPVARYVAPGTGKADFLLQHGPTMTRVGLGALGAAGIYGLSKLLAPKKEQTPEEEGNAPVAA